jgi:hypothetical protein
LEIAMRWQFGSESDPEFVANRKTVIDRIDTWWREFERSADQIAAAFSPGSQWNVAEWMIPRIHAVDPHMMWEFGPAVAGKGHRLVITPEAARHLRPLAASIIQRAPKLEGWEFYAYRLPEDAAMACQSVKARTGVDCSDYKVRIQRGESNCIDLCYFAPSITDDDDRDALKAAFVATESLLGEERLDKWVGTIDVGPIKTSSGLMSLFRSGVSDPKHLISFDRTKETFDAVVRSIRDQLPPEPHFKRLQNALWSTIQFPPADSADYPQRSDLIVGVSMNPEMIVAAHSGGVFSSERFSRCGETFCYVKLDGSDGLEGSEFGDRGDIEDAINEALIQHNIGCSIGGGTGKQYSYIDLALTNASRGIQSVRQVLQTGKAPVRSWIQFFDSDLVAEWIGVYDNSPPPPMPDFDE